MLRKIILGVIISTGVIAIVFTTLYFTFLDRIEGQYFTSDDTQIHYTVEGEGEPVILVHGFAINADLNWRLPGIIDQLKKDYRVIAMDLRSHGLSGKPHDSSAYGTQMTEDVINLMDHLNIDRAHLVGYSLGGFITLKTASLYPDRWHTVIPMGAGWEDPKTSPGMDAIQQAGADLEKHGAISPIIGYFENRKNPGYFHKLGVRFLTGWYNDSQALVAMIKAAPELTLTKEELHQIKAPLYCIIGADDPLLPGAKALKEELPRTELSIVPNATHMSTPRKSATKEKLVDCLEEL